MIIPCLLLLSCISTRSVNRSEYRYISGTKWIVVKTGHNVYELSNPYVRNDSLVGQTVHVREYPPSTQIEIALADIDEMGVHKFSGTRTAFLLAGIWISFLVVSNLIVNAGT